MAAKSTSKTVRFTQVVERSGEPHAHTLWLAPAKDVELQRAIAANRVMTVESGRPGGKSDVGKVGFDAENTPGAQILIFPKSLKRFEGARVVGIKFDLVAQPKLEVGRAPETKPTRQPKPPPAPTVTPKQRQPEADAPPPKSPAAKSRAEKPASKPSPPPVSATTDGPLVKEVRAALKELEAGKAVAAYQRLERALAN